MGVIKEWFCADHGEFESTHPICPAFGCASKEVVREHRTPPAIRSESTSRTDADLRRTAESYNIDFRSAKEGESAKVQRGGLIWGLDNASKALGAAPEAMLHRPMTFERKDTVTGEVTKFVDKFGGMQHAAELVGNTKLFDTRVEKISHKADKKPIA